MSTTVIWVGLVTAVVWFFVDFIFYALLFGKQLTSYNTEDEATQKKKNLGRMTASLIWDIVIAIIFMWSYHRLKTLHGFDSGIVSSLKFAMMVWFTGVMSVLGVNWIWFPNLRKLFRVNIPSWLVNFILAGILAGWLI